MATRPERRPSDRPKGLSHDGALFSPLELVRKRQFAIMRSCVHLCLFHNLSFSIAR
jgi:hypothetical protein